MATVLSTSNLSKHYGSIHAVQNLSLHVSSGSVFGLLGPNGSGKTTTLGIILGARFASSGNFEWFEKPLSKESLLRIGAILEQPNFYPYLSSYNNLRIVADIKDIPYANIDSALSSVNLLERKNQAVKHYSFGMKQRLAIAAALLNNPEVLVLDEPTNGLDPQGIADVRELIMRIANQGTTIILASHLLDEVERVCTHVAVMQSGRMIINGAVSDVLTDNATVELGADDEDRLFQAITQISYLKNVSKNGPGKFIVSLSDHHITGSTINRDFFDRGITLSTLSIKKKRLESYFLEVTNSKNVSHADKAVKN